MCTTWCCKMSSLRILTLGVILLLLPYLSFATDVTTSGTGATKDEAIQGALRQAVEYAAGVYLYSTTTVENSQLVSDKVITSSKSLVSNYRLITERKGEDGLIYVSLSATIDTQSISSIIHNSKGISFEDTIKDFNLISNKLEQLRKAAELLTVMKQKSVSEMYILNYLGYDVTQISLKGTTVKLKFTIYRNPFFWEAYYAILNHLKESRPFFSRSSDSNNKEVCLGYQCRDKILINSDLLDYTIGARYARAKVVGSGFEVSTTTFGLYDNNIFEYGLGANDENIDFGNYGNKYWDDAKDYIHKIGEGGLKLSIDVIISDANTIKKLQNCKINLVPRRMWGDQYSGGVKIQLNGNEVPPPSPWSVNPDSLLLKLSR